MLDKTILQQNQKRWQLVAQFEREEESQKSSLDRWKKLNALFRMATDLNLAKDVNTQDEMLVWGRWNQLRELHLSRSNS
ncbi:hypothetical protein [Candidatus Leptofilum sp.]|uniref:hypothetical protein n=1 Tax=Candidatus Leptofilum sp. TaxID=3241576 RepID=UPI003B5B8EF1